MFSGLTFNDAQAALLRGEFRELNGDEREYFGLPSEVLARIYEKCDDYALIYELDDGVIAFEIYREGVAPKLSRFERKAVNPVNGEIDGYGYEG
jgi:hypothetical protein